MGLLRRLSSIFKQESFVPSNEHLHENQQYTKKIVLENGECVNVRGGENQLNQVQTSKYTLTNCLYLLIIKFFKRFLNFYLFIINMIELDYNYLISLLLTFFIHVIIELYFDNQKKQSDEQVNSRQVTIFSDLKKNIQGLPSNTLIRISGRRSLNKNIIDHENLVNNNNYQKDICMRKVSIDTVTYRVDKQPRVPLFTMKRWDQLKVGEIIYLKNNEVCPADVLILDMGQTISMASNSVMSGNTNEVRKRACPLTTISKEHKIQLLDYRTILNGIIRYDQIDSDSYYKGMVKLKKDPKPLEITKENIFFREQLLLNDLYMFGVVLAVGLDCRCYKSFKQVEKFGFFEKKANFYFFIAIISLIVLSVIQYLIEFYGENHTNVKFQLIYYSNLLPLYFYFLIDLLYFVQILYNNAKFKKDKNLHLHAHQEANPLLDTSNIELLYQKINYNPISNLALVNHAVIDKTGTLTLPNFKIKWIFIFDSLYKIRYRVFAEKEFQQELQKNRLRKELNYPIDEKNEPPESTPMIKLPNNEEANFKLEDLDDDHPPYDELHRTHVPRFKAESQISSQFEQSAEGVVQQKNSNPRSSLVMNSLQESKRNLTYRGSAKFHAPRIPSNLEIVSEVEFSGNEVTLLKRNEDIDFKPHYFEAMFALVVCQNTRSLYQKSDDSLFYEYSSELDRQQLLFCKNYGFKFICRSKLEQQIRYIIQENDDVHLIEVMALHSFNSRKFSIIIRLEEELCQKLGLDIEDSPYIQYLRDDSLDMMGCLSLEKDQLAKLDLMIKDLQTQGSRPVLFYRSLMNVQQMNTFIKEANKLLDIQQNKVEFMSEYQFLMHEFERNCDLVTVIGVQEKIRKHAATTLNNMKQLGIPCWMASGDNYEKVLPIAYKVQLLNQNDSIVHIQAKTQDELFLQLKQQLQNLSGQLRQHSSKKDLRHSDTLLHKKGSFTCSPRWLSNGQKNLHIKQFQIIISGESLEQIVKDTFLKKHFQFLLQFTSNFIGYRMTPQQKAILIKILRDKKLHSKYILSIGDSFSDISLFNYSDFCLQIQSGRQIFPHDKNNYEDLQHGRVSIKQLDQESMFCSHKQEHSFIQPLYNADLYFRDFDIIQKLITTYVRKAVLYFERILIFALFRSFSLIYLLFITQLIQDEVDVIARQYLQFHSNIFFFLSCAFIISEISEKIEYSSHNDFQTFVFKNNQTDLSTNKFSKYIARITLFPLIQALLINLYITNSNVVDQDGRQLDTLEIGSGLFLLLLFIDQFKLMQRNYITQKQLLFNLCLSYGLYALVSLQFNQFSIVYNWILSIEFLFSFIFLIIIHSIFNLVVYQTNRPFFLPLVIQTAHEYDEIAKIYNKELGDVKRQIKQHRATIEKISYYARKIFKSDEDMDPIIKQMLSGAFADETENSINRLTLRFKSQILQSKFTEDTLQDIVKTYKTISIITFLCYEIATYVIILASKSSFEISNWTDVYYITMFGVLLLFTLFCQTRYYKIYLFQINFIILVIRCASLIIWLFNQDQNVGNISLNILQLSLTVTIYHFQQQPIISQLFSGIYVLIYVIKQSNIDDVYILVNQYVLSIATYFLLVLTFRRIIHIFLEVFLGRMNMNKENQIMGDILSILLPQFIRDRINKAGQYDIQEDQGMVAVLFCDIIDFDSLIKNEQSNVVDILDRLFRRFDSFCQQHEVQKIETVGKTYMAAAGLKIHVSQKTNPVNKVISLALDMKKYVMSHEIFQIKIGIHYGNVIAGVIGHHKPQFSLIGDTINTASRICSTAEPSDIAISEQAYRQTNKFELQYQPREVKAKGIGSLQTYIVNPKRGGKQRKQTVMIQRPPQRIQRDTKEYQNLDQVHENQLSEYPMGSNREMIPLVTRNEEPAPLVLNKKQRNEIYNYVTKTQKQIALELTPSKLLQQQLQQQQSIQQFNINAGGGSSKNNVSQSIVAGIQQQSQIYDDKQQKHQDLIQILERKTKCDLNVSDYQINMDYDVEKDKIRAIYSVDEEVKGQTLLLTLNPKKLYLEFNEDETITQEFYEFLSSLYRPFAVQYLITIGFCILISSISCVSVKQFIFLPSLIFGTLIGLLHLILCTLVHKYESFYNVTYFTILAYLLLFSYTLDCFMITDYYEIHLAKGIIYGLSIFLNRLLRHQHKLLYLILYIIVTICAIIINKWPWSYLYYTLIIAIFSFFIQLFMFLKNVNSYNVNKQLIEKSVKYQFLLNYLLPKNVLEEFFRPNEEKRVLREQADEVTLLFADIAGFTEYSRKVQPEQVVNMLRNLFTEFDKNCLLHNVFKLYTIGDCYVVMGMVDYGKGIQRNPSQEAVNVVKMGFAMIDAIRRVRAHINHPTLDMRIGVHTGSIIGGVLGTELVRYDIYGPDVLIANKMESKGAKGFVQVSQETKDIIERDFPDLLRFEFTQEIEFESIDRKTSGYFVYQ